MVDCVSSDSPLNVRHNKNNTLSVALSFNPPSSPIARRTSDLSCRVRAIFFGSIFRVVHWQASVAGRDGQQSHAVRHQSVDQSHRPGQDNHLNCPGVRFDRSLRRGDGGGGTSARFSARRKQGGRRGPRTNDSKRFARSAISILLRGPRRPPCCLRVKNLPACRRHMFPPLSEATAHSNDCPVVSFCRFPGRGATGPDDPDGLSADSVVAECGYHSLRYPQSWRMHCSSGEPR